MLSLLLMTLVAGPSADSVDGRISEALARERAAVFTAVRYVLAFTVPAYRQQPVLGRLVLRMTMAGPHRIVIDFSAPSDRIRSIRVGEAEITPIYSEDHL